MKLAQKITLFFMYFCGFLYLLLVFVYSPSIAETVTVNVGLTSFIVNSVLVYSEIKKFRQMVLELVCLLIAILVINLKDFGLLNSAYTVIVLIAFSIVYFSRKGSLNIER